MGLFDFFRKNNPKKNMLDDLYSGLEKIADSSYRIFLESFDFDERTFGEATRFETCVAILFYIDYFMSGNISENIRKNFYELAKVKIIERFSNKLSNTNLSDIVDYRYYEEYSEITMKMGEHWLQSFNNLYEVKLKGTENTDTIKKLPGIKYEGLSEQVPSKAMFRVKNSSARIIRMEVKINLNMETLLVWLEENLVRFPDEISEWSFWIGKKNFEKIMNRSNEEKSKLIRLISLEYLSLDGGKIYHFKLQQSFNPIENQWKNISEKVD